MSYTPTEWKTGDVVTSAKLNKLEQGVAAAGATVLTASFDYEYQDDALSGVTITGISGIVSALDNIATDPTNVFRYFLVLSDEENIPTLLSGNFNVSNPCFQGSVGSATVKVGVFDNDFIFWNDGEIYAEATRSSIVDDAITLQKQ